jgi:replicative DNA helicase
VRDELVEQLRAPPMSIEAEQAVLGGLMLAPDALDLVADILTTNDFYRRDHQLIFQGISELAEKGKPYDAVTLGEWFEAHGQSEIVAGGAYLIELASTTPSAANIKAYAEIVHDKAVLRQLIEEGTYIVNRGYQPDGDETANILADAENRIMRVGNRQITEADNAENFMRRTAKELGRRRALKPDELLGVTTGHDELDEYTLGYQEGDLVIIGARPSMGKTAVVRSQARAASRAGIANVTFSMEMAAEQLGMRDIAAVGRIDLRHVQRPSRASDAEMDAMRKAIASMRHYPWHLDDTAGLTINQIVARLRRLKRQYGIKVAYIDYLQLIDIARLLKDMNLSSALQVVTRTLKAAAKELHIAIVLLSQLNRSPEGRGDKRPVMSDLRESGAIEQDADIIVFVHRPAYYEPDLDRDDPKRNLMELILAKNRNGETGICTAFWEGRHQRVDNLSYQQLPATVYERKNSGFEPRRTHGLVNNGGT